MISIEASVQGPAITPIVQRRVHGWSYSTSACHRRPEEHCVEYDQWHPTNPHVGNQHPPNGIKSRPQATHARWFEHARQASRTPPPRATPAHREPAAVECAIGRQEQPGHPHRNTRDGIEQPRDQESAERVAQAREPPASSRVWPHDPASMNMPKPATHSRAAAIHAIDSRKGAESTRSRGRGRTPRSGRWPGAVPRSRQAGSRAATDPLASEDRVNSSHGTNWRTGSIRRRFAGSKSRGAWRRRSWRSRTPRRPSSAPCRRTARRGRTPRGASRALRRRSRFRVGSVPSRSGPPCPCNPCLFKASEYASAHRPQCGATC